MDRHTLEAPPTTKWQPLQGASTNFYCKLARLCLVHFQHPQQSTSPLQSPTPLQHPNLSLYIWGVIQLLFHEIFPKLYKFHCEVPGIQFSGPLYPVGWGAKHQQRDLTGWVQVSAQTTKGPCLQVPLEIGPSAGHLGEDKHRLLNGCCIESTKILYCS